MILCIVYLKNQLLNIISGKCQYIKTYTLVTSIKMSKNTMSKRSAALTPVVQWPFAVWVSQSLHGHIFSFVCNCLKVVFAYFEIDGCWQSSYRKAGS